MIIHLKFLFFKFQMLSRTFKCQEKKMNISGLKHLPNIGVGVMLVNIHALRIKEHAELSSVRYLFILCFSRLVFR